MPPSSPRMSPYLSRASVAAMAAKERHGYLRRTRSTWFQEKRLPLAAIYLTVGGLGGFRKAAAGLSRPINAPSGPSD
jgi:hypothetical protein